MARRFFITPTLAARRQDVLIWPVATTVFLRLTLLDADLGYEGYAFELLEADRTGGTRLRALVIGVEAKRGAQDRFQCAAVDLNGPSVSGGCTL
jgi:hypothetical protein